MGCTNITSGKKNKIRIEIGKGVNKNNLNTHSKAGDKSITKSKESSLSNTNSSEIPNTCLSIKVSASPYQVMFPVWVEKNKKIKIYVQGKWSMLPDAELVDYHGHINFNYKTNNNFIGALMGRVLGGKPFLVKNDMVLVSEIDGPLYFYANWGGCDIQPNGSLNIYIDNAHNKSLEEIEYALGWDLASLDTAARAEYMSEQERQQFVLLNKVRSNPKLFAMLYLSYLKGEGPAYEEIYQKLLHYPSSKLLNPSKSLYLAAKDHARDLGENGITGHLSTDGGDVKSRLTKYSNNPLYFGENCSYGLTDPLQIVIQLLVDDGVPSRTHRSNILNEGYDQIGVSVQPHSCYNWTCVQVFGCNIKDKKVDSIQP